MNELLTMLDTKYKRLEYIQSTGTQYIDTGYKANQDTTVILDCFYNTRANVDLFFGNYNYIDNAVYQSFSFGHNTKNNTTRLRAVYGTQSYINDNYDYSIRHIFKLDKNKFYADDVLLNTFNEEIFETTYNCLLFAGKFTSNNSTFPSDTYHSRMKVYSCQIFDDNTLVRNFIPVLRKSDNELGMLDLVEGKFYGNAGTGKFTANLDTMYALIQGNPTVQDGRVCGFTSSNYLKINNYIFNSNFEIKLKFNLQNSNNEINCLLGYQIYGGVIAIGVTRDKNICMYLSTNDTSWNICSEISSNTIDLNRDYFLKFSYNGSIYKIELSTNDELYETVCSNNSNDLIFNGNPFPLIIGSGHYINNWSFNGTIDLNRSYIKIDDTKYKLQAVVGFTVVGNPTITDGVVSGFSGSDYVHTNSVFDTTQNFEIVVKINTGTIDSSYLNIICRNAYGDTPGDAGFLIGISSNKLRTYLDDTEGTRFVNGQYGISTFRDNTDYLIKFSQIGNIITLESSSDNGLNWTTENTWTHQYKIRNSGQGVAFGAVGTTAHLDGSIDFNISYIKINNKLWFNGLEQ